MLGKPADFAKRYADDGADELLYIDTVASLYGRNQLENLIEETSRNVFIPISVSGAIRNVADVRKALFFGADKTCVNTHAIADNGCIPRIRDSVGSQAIVVSIEAKRVNGGWEAYTHCGRNPSGKDAVKWAQEAASLGAGEILITSIDRDGTRKGPDMELLKAIKVDVPVIYSGGIRLCDVVEVAQYSDGMAIGASLHYGDCTINEIKNVLQKSGKEIR